VHALADRSDFCVSMLADDRVNSMLWQHSMDRSVKSGSPAARHGFANSSRGTEVVCQAYNQIVDAAQIRYLIRIDFHLKVVLDSEDHRNHVERVEAKLFQQ
jgi:hypothetical protein